MDRRAAVATSNLPPSEHSAMTIDHFVMTMKATSTLLMCGAILLLCLLFSPQQARAQSSAVSPLVDDPSPKQVQTPSDTKPMATNCYTNAENCAGHTTFGGFRYAVECSIWWNNGADGRSTMTFQAGQSHDYYVRYNDVGSCTGTQYGTPPNSQRFYLYVHN
jgi:hypothetical protein